MNKNKRVYLAGKMAGEEQYNFPAFMSYAKQLRDNGCIVFNPAENDYVLYGHDFLEHPERFNAKESMGDDLRWICTYADALALIPGWEKGRGVLIEKALAEYLNLEVIYL